MSDNKKPIGILGGTFDPIHYGHLKIAEYILEKCEFETIQFIPNRTPPHRRPPFGSANHRYEMVKLAIKNHPKFSVNDLEITRPSPSYMIDTLQILQSQRPNQPLCLIIGSDAFNHFNEWLHWQKILDIAHLIVVNRSKNGLIRQPWMQKLLQSRCIDLPEKLATKNSGYILIIQIEPIPISASRIREKLKKQEDVSNMLPNSVLNYIIENKLYE